MFFYKEVDDGLRINASMKMGTKLIDVVDVVMVSSISLKGLYLFFIHNEYNKFLRRGRKKKACLCEKGSFIVDLLPATAHPRVVGVGN